MKSRLCIDIGNTRVKLAIFRDGNLLHFSSFMHNETEGILKFISEHPFDSAIYASVIKENLEWLHSLASEFPVHRLSLSSKIPLKLDQYLTPESLGADRIAAMAGGRMLDLDAAILIVNTGTCVTYDVLSANGEFIGGNIAPGLEMRWKAMHAFTSSLPLVNPQHAVESFLGHSTVTALENGGFQGLLMEIEGYFYRLRDNYPGLKCVLTGGSAHKFVNQLKIDIFADPYLVLKGLNHILEINESL